MDKRASSVIVAPPMAGPLSQIIKTLGETEPTPEVSAVVPVTLDLTPNEKAMLFDLVAGVPGAVIAADHEMPWIEFKDWKRSPKIKQALATVTGNLVSKIERGDFGALPIAKASAEGAMVQLLRLMNSAKSDETKRKCANDLLAYGGYQPVKKVQTMNVDEFLGAMTQVELEEFAASGTVPDRLRDAANFKVAQKLPQAIEAQVVSQQS